jgi:diacylglycerol diphosphate phosphatase / phosphatidate phosphatase
LQYKHLEHDRVPNPLLWLISIVSPAVILALWTMVIDGVFSHKVGGKKIKYTLKDRLSELNAGWLGLGLAISMQYVIVSTLC